MSKSESSSREPSTGQPRIAADSRAGYSIGHLSADERADMFRALARSEPEHAARLLSLIEDPEAATYLQDLAPDEAARIVEHLPSNDRVDILARLDADQAAAVLDTMETSRSADLRQQLQYASDTAGGLMVTEYLVYGAEQRVSEVIADLARHGEQYANYEVRHVYSVDSNGRFLGHVPFRRLVMTNHDARLSEVGVRSTNAVPVEARVHDIEDALDAARQATLPVVDARGKLLGVVTRAAVEEARKEEQATMLLKFGGIVGGEELRSMPTLPRAMRRMAFLLPNIALSYVAVSVIAMYEPLIERVTALAMVLPMVANLTGAAGNQAVAVSIRELSLGLVGSQDVLRVWRQELKVGAMFAVAIGAVLSLITWATRGAPMLAATVGLAYVGSCIFAVLLGGSLPLLLSRLGVDPAMLSSPILTTLTDMTAFLLTLSIASALLLAGLPV